MNQGIRRILALAAVFMAAFAIVYAVRNGPEGFRRLISNAKDGRDHRPERFTPADKAPLELDDVGLIHRLNEEYAKLTAAVVPSVVSIDTSRVSAQPVFGRQLVRTQGQGSGVIVSQEGHMVTNYHVIRNQQQIQVTLHNGSTYPATLIGEDPLIDIAVLKIQGDAEFQPLKFGDSSEVKRGQIVFAIGNPFGLGETITQGIISALERSVSDTQRDLFQTDAAINPGNSGGPLVNLRGEIIGINSAIYRPDERVNSGFQGVGFSIPSNDVRNSLYAILERGRPVHGYLGVSMDDITPLERLRLDFQGPGAVVKSITEGSPAQAAGLQPDDVVLSYDGERINGIAALFSLVQRSRVGREVPIQIWRAGQTLTVTARIAESRPEVLARIESDPPGKIRETREVLEAVGIQVRELAPIERASGYKGVVVVGIAASSLSEGRIQPGDLIVAVSENDVQGAADFYENLAASAAAQATSIQLYRRGLPLRVILPVLPRADSEAGTEEKAADGGTAGGTGAPDPR